MVKAANPVAFQGQLGLQETAPRPLAPHPSKNTATEPCPGQEGPPSNYDNPQAQKPRGSFREQLFRAYTFNMPWRAGGTLLPPIISPHGKGLRG